jgi:hypothetical protein
MERIFERLKFEIGDERILKKMPTLQVGMPFEEGRIDFLNQVSRELLSDRKAREYPDVVTFAFWIRKANMEQERKEFLSNNRFCMGRGVVFHIAPSNVAVNYAYSFAVGFVLGNGGIVRMPSKEFPQVELINWAVRKTLEKGEYERWRDVIVFLRYERNREVNDYLSSICDVRVIWGGDSTIREIRKSELPPRAGEITFADRYSLCVIDAEKYMAVADKDRMAMDFYNDTYLTDQNACTSPRLVCWLGEKGRMRQVKELFWERLWNVVSEKYVFQPVQYVDKLVNCCMAAVAAEGIHVVKVKDNRIVRIEVERLDSVIQEYRGDSGTFYECEISDIMELAPICNGKVQTVVMVGDRERMVPLVMSGVKGIDRMVEVGKSMEFGFVWDGMDLRERLTRGCRYT